MINKTNEELESRQNAMVEDLEKVINEVYSMQFKVEGADFKISKEAQKLNKAVNDLEAHINTSIITVSINTNFAGKISQEGAGSTARRRSRQTQQGYECSD